MTYKLPCVCVVQEFDFTRNDEDAQNFLTS